MPNSPTDARRSRRQNRHQQLIDASIAVFSAKGVSATSVDDIVQAAGVAKGTFYLYFATKDDAVNAVAERMVEGVADRIEAIATDPDRSPVDRLLAFGAGIAATGREAYEHDVIEVLHRPENRVLHDRMSERAFVRLTPAFARIISEGIERGQFRPQHARRSAAYVMACFGSLHEVVSDPADVPRAISELNAFVLCALGYEGQVSG